MSPLDYHAQIAAAIEAMSNTEYQTTESTPYWNPAQYDRFQPTTSSSAEEMMAAMTTTNYHPSAPTDDVHQVQYVNLQSTGPMPLDRPQPLQHQPTLHVDTSSAVYAPKAEGLAVSGLTDPSIARQRSAFRFDECAKRSSREMLSPDLKLVTKLRKTKYDGYKTTLFAIQKWADDTKKLRESDHARLTAESRARPAWATEARWETSYEIQGLLQQRQDGLASAMDRFVKNVQKEASSFDDMRRSDVDATDKARRELDLTSIAASCDKSFEDVKTGFEGLKAWKKEYEAHQMEWKHHGDDINKYRVDKDQE